MPENRSSELFDLRLQKYSLASLLGAIAFYMLGIALNYVSVSGFQWIQHDLSNLMRDVAIALAVGVYLMWTLERLNAFKIEGEVNQYIKEVGEGFIKAVYGKQLPDELFQVIKSTIFEQSFVRSVYNAEIRLHRLARFSESAPDAVKFNLERFLRTAARNEVDSCLIAQFMSYYEVTNVSDKRAKYRVYWELVRPLGGEIPGLIGLTSVLINGEQQLERLYTENPGGTDGSHLIFLREPIVEPGARLTVQLETYSVRRREDKEPWQTMIPCHGMQATVIDYDTSSEILIWLDAPANDRDPHKARKDPQTNTARLRVSQYLLPYQGMTIYWSPAQSDQQQLDFAQPKLLSSGDRDLT
jgi:hypothetical protein